MQDNKKPPTRHRIIFTLRRKKRIMAVTPINNVTHAYLSNSKDYARRVSFKEDNSDDEVLEYTKTRPKITWWGVLTAAAVITGIVILLSKGVNSKEEELGEELVGEFEQKAGSKIKPATRTKVKEPEKIEEDADVEEIETETPEEEAGDEHAMSTP